MVVSSGAAEKADKKKEEEEVQLAHLGAVFEAGHDIPADINVLEHALELVRKLRPTLRFELADGAFFRVNARALPQKQPLGEILLVESFKDILARDVP